REQGLALAPVGQLVHAVARESRAGIAGEPGGEQELGAVVPLDPERVVLGYDAGRGRLRQLAGIEPAHAGLVAIDAGADVAVRIVPDALSGPIDGLKIRRSGIGTELLGAMRVPHEGHAGGSLDTRLVALATGVAVVPLV